MHTDIHIYTQPHTRTHHTHTYIYAHRHIHTIHLSTHTCIRIYTHACIYTCTGAHTLMYMNIYIYRDTCIYTLKGQKRFETDRKESSGRRGGPRNMEAKIAMMWPGCTHWFGSL